MPRKNTQANQVQVPQVQVPAVQASYTNPNGNFSVSQSGSTLTITVDLSTLMSNPESMTPNKFGSLTVASSYDNGKKYVTVPLGTDSSLSMQLGIYANRKEWVKAEPKKLTTKDEVAVLKEQLAAQSAESAELRDMLKQFMAMQMKK